jgi:hypothetical protein
MRRRRGVCMMLASELYRPGNMTKGEGGRGEANDVRETRRWNDTRGLGFRPQVAAVVMCSARTSVNEGPLVVQQRQHCGGHLSRHGRLEEIVRRVRMVHLQYLCN